MTKCKVSLTYNQIYLTIKFSQRKKDLGILKIQRKMPLNKIIKRELEVAFAKHAQRAWIRVLKYIILAAIIYFSWGTKWLWIILLALFAPALLVHFFYRYKTKGWTKSYGGWDYEKNKPGQVK